jgi:uncharacterized protein
MTEIVDAAERPWALLHDAAEAYLGDMAGTLKVTDSPLGVAYREAEERVMRVIATRFGLAWPEPPAVAVADRSMLVAEFRSLMSLHDEDLDWLTDRHGTAYSPEITPWRPPAHAEATYLDTYRALQNAGVVH